MIVSVVMVSYHTDMNENEKPAFWSPALILLVAINILFLGLILAGLIVMYQVLSGPIQTWLTARFGL
jgi:hypothetical protein